MGPLSRKSPIPHPLSGSTSLVGVHDQIDFAWLAFPGTSLFTLSLLILQPQDIASVTKGHFRGEKKVPPPALSRSENPIYFVLWVSWVSQPRAGSKLIFPMTPTVPSGPRGTVTSHGSFGLGRFFSSWEAILGGSGHTGIVPCDPPCGMCQAQWVSWHNLIQKCHPWWNYVSSRFLFPVIIFDHNPWQVVRSLGFSFVPSNKRIIHH